MNLEQLRTSKRYKEKIKGDIKVQKDKRIKDYHSYDMGIWHCYNQQKYIHCNFDTGHKINVSVFLADVWIFDQNNIQL